MTEPLAVPAYEAPTLSVVGSLHGLTQTGNYPKDIPCFWTKTIGPPDYFTFIPIANCSS
ncbi:MAG: hypothetical protein ACXWZB_07180 [Gaiellaceae bacterium]